jgi:hypothetical protein
MLIFTQWLKRPDNFGKYGKIAKVVINKSNLSTGTRPPNVRSPTVSAYITFARKEDAYRCIKAIDSTWLDGKLLRASFGTTKYCAYFLRGIPCTNPDCMYLHDYGDEEDTFNKEDIVLRNGLPVPHNSAKLSQFYPHLDDPSPCEKHFWSFKDSNVPPPDSFEAAYDDDDDYHHRHHEEDEYDDIDAHDQDDNYEGEYDDLQQWASSGDDEIEEQEIEQHVPTNEYAKDNLDPNGSILPSTAKWGKKSPESKNKKKKKKGKAAKQPQPIPIQPPLDVNNAWSTISKSKTTTQQQQQQQQQQPQQQVTPRTKVTITAKSVELSPPQKFATIIAPPVPSATIKQPEKVQEKKVQQQIQPVKQDDKLEEKPKQNLEKKQKKTPTKKDEETNELAIVQDVGAEDEATLHEPLPIDLDMPLESDVLFSEKDQIHTPISQAFSQSDAALHANIPKPFTSVDPLLSTNTGGGLWGAGLQASQQQQAPQQAQQQYGNANNFVQSLMQFGLASADYASQLQHQQHQFPPQLYQPHQMPGAVDLGDLPWENNPFVEPTRTRSRFEFAQFGSSKSATQPFVGDTWKTPSSDQWGSSFGNDIGTYNSSDLQQSFRALLPNVNINFSSQGTVPSSSGGDSAWGFNQTNNQGVASSKNNQNGQNISINNNINNINININNHHHTPNYSNNFNGYIPNKDGTTTTTTTSFSFGGNPFAGDSWGFTSQSTPTMFSSMMPQDPIFSPQQDLPLTKEEVEKPKANNTATNNKKSKGKKGKGKN